MRLARPYEAPVVAAPSKGTLVRQNDDVQRRCYPWQRVQGEGD
jgi:hypothetical protein